MASSGSMTRPPCADREDMPNKWENAKLDEVTEKVNKTPSCWCGDVCKVKVSTDRKKLWTEGRRFFVCPNYAHDRRLPTNAYDVPPSPPPLCKYFTWIDQDVPEDVKKDQYQDCLRRQRRFEEAFQRGLDEERRQKEKMERKKREEERARKEKVARAEERARKLARARDAQEEDEARYKKGKGPMFP
ncbi:hypothetical protein CFC21_006725 [Triticum aestivum]|uniref:GRF-type domain-containing protein n=2 Tax=Triticum aestivum TaxID=4565 RepID=A0A3B5YWJ8_WHEAT|nr:uncharacterized protein LOC123091442 [Triticum aestivum]KAF6989387.1 hypothetical protein CFC21_006725 [Triticum aestivum]